MEHRVYVVKGVCGHIFMLPFLIIPEKPFTMYFLVWCVLIMVTGAMSLCRTCACVADRLVCHSQPPTSWDAIPKNIQHADLSGVPLQRLSLVDIGRLPDLLTLDLRGCGQCITLSSQTALPQKWTTPPPPPHQETSGVQKAASPWRTLSITSCRTFCSDLGE